RPRPPSAGLLSPSSPWPACYPPTETRARDPLVHECVGPGKVSGYSAFVRTVGSADGVRNAAGPPRKGPHYLRRCQAAEAVPHALPQPYLAGAVDRHSQASRPSGSSSSAPALLSNHTPPSCSGGSLPSARRETLSPVGKCSASDFG